MNFNDMFVSKINMKDPGRDFDYQKMMDVIEEEYLKENRSVGPKRKTTYRPSSLGYGDGTCPRRHYLAFSGVDRYDESSEAKSILTMSVGTDAHTRLQAKFEAAGIMKEEERELIVEDPPIRGFIDAIVEIDGVEAVGEFKTARSESFSWRELRDTPLAYHLYQLLCYMYFEKIDQGFLWYENKNDGRTKVMPVRMNDYTKKVIEDCLEWLRMVYSNWEQDAVFPDEIPEDAPSSDKSYWPKVSYENLPMRPWRKKNKICKQCPVFDECWNVRPEGTVEIDPMEVVQV